MRKQKIKKILDLRAKSEAPKSAGKVEAGKKVVPKSRLGLTKPAAKKGGEEMDSSPLYQVGLGNPNVRHL